jgi:hypothetical protein
VTSRVLPKTAECVSEACTFLVLHALLQTPSHDRALLFPLTCFLIDPIEEVCQSKFAFDSSIPMNMRQDISTAVFV